MKLSDLNFKGSFSIFILFFANLLFVLAYACVKYISKTVPTTQIIFVRFAVAPILLAPFFIFKKIKFTAPNPYLLITRSIIGCLGMYMYYLGLRYGDLGKTMLLANMSAIWTFLISSLFLKESFQLKKFIALIIALIAVSVILKPTGFTNIGKAEFFAIGSSICSSFVAISMKKLRENHNTVSMIFVFFTISFLLFLPANLSWNLPLMSWQMAVLILIGILGFFAHFFNTMPYKYTSATIANSMGLSAIPMSYLLGVFIFHDPVDAIAIAGMLVFCIALYVVIS